MTTPLDFELKFYVVINAHNGARTHIKYENNWFITFRDLCLLRNRYQSQRTSAFHSTSISC